MLTYTRHFSKHFRGLKRVRVVAVISGGAGSKGNRFLLPVTTGIILVFFHPLVHLVVDSDHLGKSVFELSFMERDKA